MDVKKYLEKIKEFWNSRTKEQKTSFIIASVIITVILIGVFYLYNRDSYEFLLSTDNPQITSNVVNELKTRNIKYQIRGKAIYVTGTNIDELKLDLSGKGILSENDTSLSLFQKPLFISESQEKNLEKTLLEQKLANTIKSYKEVSDAKVHITFGQDSYFEENKTPSKAAVVLSLKSKLNANQIKSIQELVAASVPNLTSENVVITDTDNNLLTDDSNVYDEKYVYNLEKNISKQINDLLSGIYKDIAFKIAVRVEMDYDKKKIEKESVESNPNTIVSKQTTVDRAYSGDNVAVQPPGTDSNIPSYQTPNVSGVKNYSEKTNEVVNYELNKTKEYIIKSPEIKRLSVAVVANKKLTTAEETKIKEIVSTAALIDEKRGDMVSVQSFESNIVVDNKKKIDYMFYLNFLLEKLPYIIISVILLILFKKSMQMFSRFMETNEEEQESIIIEEPHKEENIYFINTKQRIRKEMEDNSEQVANVIKIWQQED